MSKAVNRGAKIVLGGVDITDSVSRWSIDGPIGELYVAEIDLIDNGVVEITEEERTKRYATMENLGVQQRVNSLKGIRVPIADVIKVKGVDISSWITGYDKRVRVKCADEIRLYVQCDKDVLSINGTHPWEHLN